MSDRKRLKIVILCTKSVQIEIQFHLVHKNMLIFCSEWLKLICFSIIVLQKMFATNFAEKQQKEKVEKQRNT